MKKNWRLPIVLLIVCVGLIVIWLAGSVLTNPVPDEFKSTPENAIRIQFSSESGASVHGWLFEAKNPIAQAALMHGVRSNRGQMVARAEHLQVIGITSMVFDFQAHGESVGDIITLGYLESLDAQAAIDFLDQRNTELPKFVIGVSMGGAAAIMSKPKLAIDALVVESVYPDVKTAISNRLSSRIPGGHLLAPLLSLQIKPRIGISANDLSPVKYAQTLSVPALVLSGSEDQRTTKEDTQRLFESFIGPKQLYLFDGVGHIDLERHDSEQYWRVVEPFIREHLRN